ncbi:MAG: SRPBCC domain-containing protein [Actinomycetota bacterium]
MSERPIDRNDQPDTPVRNRPDGTAAEPSVSVDVDIAVDPAQVWDALVTEGGLGAWMGRGASLEPRPGGSLSFPDPVGGRQRDGRVQTVVEGERLAFTWWTADRPTDRSSVTITLQPVDTGTRVTVVETMAPPSQVGFTVPALPVASTGAPGSATAGPGVRVSASAGTDIAMRARRSSVLGLWSWRLAVVTLATQMVRV